MPTEAREQIITVISIKGTVYHPARSTVLQYDSVHCDWYKRANANSKEREKEKLQVRVE
jgi:hypothetical protein